MASQNGRLIAEQTSRGRRQIDRESDALVDESEGAARDALRCGEPLRRHESKALHAKSRLAGAHEVPSSRLLRIRPPSEEADKHLDF